MLNKRKNEKDSNVTDPQLTYINDDVGAMKITIIMAPSVVCWSAIEGKAEYDQGPL